MKIRYLLVLLAIILVSSCATKAPTGTVPATPEETPVITEPPETVEPETPVETPEVVEPEEKPETTTIEIMYAGFDPKELTVKKGTIVTFKSVQGKHKLTIDGKGTPNIEEGGTYEYTANKVGEITVFNIFTKKKMSIIVTESS